MADVAVFDIDGTLVDTNYHHALAWYRAFRAHGLTVPGWRLHRTIGMGGDQLVAAVAGDEVEERLGDALREEWAAEFAPMLEEIQPFAGAARLLREVRERGFRLVLASSGKPDHVEHYLDLVDGKAVAEAWTSSADVENTKPAPDLLQVAVDKVGGGAEPVMIGDSAWDFVAARKAGYLGYGVLSGGFGEGELRDAGAAAVYDSVESLRAALDDTALRAPTS